MLRLQCRLNAPADDAGIALLEQGIMVKSNGNYIFHFCFFLISGFFSGSFGRS